MARNTCTGNLCVADAIKILILSLLVSSAIADDHSISLSFHLNGSLMDVTPIYDASGVPIRSNEPLYMTVPSISFNSDVIDVSVSAMAETATNTNVLCDFQLETHSGGKSYRLSENMTSLPLASVDAVLLPLAS